MRTLKEGISTSNGTTASIPYTKEYGVAPVDVLIAIRYAWRA